MRRFLKLLTPPIFLDIIRSLRSDKAQIFSGCYESFGEVTDQNPWASKECLDFSREKLQKTLLQEKVSNTPLSDLGGYLSVVTFIVNLFSAKNSCNVLDFSGGTGFIYYSIQPFLLNTSNVKWICFDCNNDLLLLGKEHAEKYDYQNIEFISNFSEDIQYNILYINTSVQYIENFYQLLADKLLLSSPSCLVFTRLLAGEIKSFVTCEAVLGYKTPCRFLNTGELITFLSWKGYSLIHSSVNHEGSSPKISAIKERSTFTVKLTVRKMRRLDTSNMKSSQDVLLPLILWLKIKL